MNVADKTKGESPKHYQIPGMNIEVIDLIKAYQYAITDPWRFFLWASALQYIMRFALKGEPEKDLGKGLTYLTWLKGTYDDENKT